MNDSPGWAPPGSAPSNGPGPSDGPDRDAPEPTAPAGEAEGGESAAGATAGANSPPQWSKQQPPAGQWSAPTGGPAPRPPAQGGWGPPGNQGRPGGNQGGWGNQGWGAGWAATPAAAKPGVIPLRPLGVGEILDGSVSTMRAHWRTVLGISLAVAVVIQFVATLSTGLWFRDTSSLDALGDNPSPSLDETMDAVGGPLGSTGITWLIGMLGTIITTALLTMVISRAVLGRGVSTSEAWRDARPQLPRLIGLLFLLPLIVTAVTALAVTPGLIVAATGSAAGGAALLLLGGLGGLVAAIWLWIRYSLAAPALMLEKQGVIASMRRSAKLVRGAWWRVCGIQLLALLVVMIVAGVVGLVSSVVAMLFGGASTVDWLLGDSSTTSWSFLVITGVGAVISSTVTFPISAGVTALLYVDQRIRREALDLELARAAGLPGYGADAAGSPQPTDAAPGS
ncbi:DUF7544 domain-containing protein [Streptomyces sp. H27-D2]|uniref:DUF7544 domain-containing protein n=1 Tax=Streptomyces sp. H27-D2 TaxID=3046304 RepID=UPI002DBCC0F0|nr:hypothetical protein [Streptomyces sp. H27-D2]MEC4019617.1 hypothetical protein [Streptomyces sp. H27-D2]